MTPETIITLQNQINDLEKNLSELKKVVTLLKLHDQSKVESNSKITPGIASKIAYDEKGLIISGSHLERSDIPTISIDQVEGLRNLISTKADISQVNKSIEAIDTISKSDEVYDSGCKINFDKNGFVVSGAPLTVDDIPTIPIEHVEGLVDKLQSITDSKSSSITSEIVKDTKIKSGTYTKVTIDTDGTVLSGSNLVMNDIPIEIINKINQIESKLPTFAARDIVDNISKQLSTKLNFTVSDITPGTYTKVKVSKDGIITKGDKLNIRDLPEINIKDITDLDSTLKAKADQLDLIKLTESVSSIISMASEFSRMNLLQSQIDAKASKSEFVSLSNNVSDIQEKLNDIYKVISGDSIIMQFNDIQNELAELSGKISAIEHRLNLSDSFDED